MKHVCILLFFCAFTGTAFSQNGTVAGKVYDASRNEPLVGATVMVDNSTAHGAFTDVEGRYVIPNVAPGTHTVSVKYVSYNAKEITGVEVKTGETASVDVAMETQASELQAVVITSTRTQESINSLLTIQKNSATVQDGVSADLIKRSPDRNSSDVLKRVPGTTIVDGKFVVVRGLSDKYNNAMLNGTPLPSTEPDKKNFSFDLIPANMIESIVIVKTAQPDLPGDFAGGIIQQNLRDVPENNFVNMSIGGSYRVNTTFKDFYAFDRGKHGWLGLNDGTQNIPDDFPTTHDFNHITPQAGKIAPSKVFTNSWDTSKASAPLNQAYSLSAGWAPKALNNKTGLLFSMNYNNSRRVDASTRSDFSDDVNPDYEYNDTYHRNNTNWGTMLRLGQKIGSAHKVFANATYTVNTQYSTGMREGAHHKDGVFVKSLMLYTVENKLLNAGLGGEHFIKPVGVTVKWNGGYGNILRDEPDYRRINYKMNMTPAWEGDTPVFLAAIPVGSADQNMGGRFFSNLSEDIYNANASASLPFMIGKQKHSFKTGYYFQKRDRLFDARQLGYVKHNAALFGAGEVSATEMLTMAPDEIFDPANMNVNGFRISDITNPQDSYTALSEVHAAFGMFDTRLNSKLRIVWGVRAEHYEMELHSALNSGEPVDVEHRPNDSLGNRVDWLPSVNLVYALTAKSNVRLAFSKTVSRPEFRETAPFSFYDFATSSSIMGNPDLLPSDIYNADARYEVFLGQGQILAATAFYKQFTSPVELASVTAGAGSRARTYQNSTKADNYGFELEARQNLAVVDRWFSTKAFKNFTAYVNLALIKSEVLLDSTSAAGGKASRAMQGQSPYVFNAGLTYLPQDGDFSASLLFNVIGRRIHEVGDDKYPDIYEAPRPVLDFQVSKNLFKNGTVKFTASDVLQRAAVFYQDRDESGKFESTEDALMQRTRYAMTCGLSFSYKF
ncbi:MAG TPA: TonB-dependent receptor [Chitinophagales bacterium]|nr:TonB-dependent receptor [Chitinophagales bacterium]